MMKYFFKYVLRWYYKIFFGVVMHDTDRIPSEGGYMLCSNHMNAQDPLIIGVMMKTFIRYMAKKELFASKLGHWFFTVNGAFPVDRDGNDISAVKTSIKTLKGGEPMVMFPEGTRNHTNIPLEAKPGIAMIAIKSKVPVVPITIKANYKPFNKIHMYFHDPIYLDEYFGKRLSSDDYQKISQSIINKIYEDFNNESN